MNLNRIRFRNPHFRLPVSQRIEMRVMVKTWDVVITDRCQLPVWNKIQRKTNES